MRITNLLEHANDVVDEEFAAAHGHAKQLGHLRQRNNDGRRIGEADDDRM